MPLFNHRKHWRWISEHVLALTHDSLFTLLGSVRHTFAFITASSLCGVQEMILWGFSSVLIWHSWKLKALLVWDLLTVWVQWTDCGRKRWTLLVGTKGPIVQRSGTGFEPVLELKPVLCSRRQRTGSQEEDLLQGGTNSLLHQGLEDGGHHVLQDQPELCDVGALVWSLGSRHVLQRVLFECFFGVVVVWSSGSSSSLVWKCLRGKKLNPQLLSMSCYMCRLFVKKNKKQIQGIRNVINLLKHQKPPNSSPGRAAEGISYSLLAFQGFLTSHQKPLPRRDTQVEAHLSRSHLCDNTSLSVSHFLPLVLITSSWPPSFPSPLPHTIPIWALTSHYWDITESGILLLSGCGLYLSLPPQHAKPPPSPDMSPDTLISFDRRSGCHHNPCCLDLQLITLT